MRRIRRPRMIVGIDPSTKKIAAGYCVEGKKPEVEAVDLPKFPDRLLTAYRWAEAFADDHQHHELYAFIEKPVQSRNIGSTIVQAEVQGAIIAGLLAGGVKEVTQVNVQSWKKAVVGNGNSTKPDVARHMKETWPYYTDLAGDDQDLIDAGAILRYGLDTLRTMDKIALNMKKGK